MFSINSCIYVHMYVPVFDQFTFVSNLLLFVLIFHFYKIKNQPKPVKIKLQYIHSCWKPVRISYTYIDSSLALVSSQSMLDSTYLHVCVGSSECFAMNRTASWLMFFNSMYLILTLTFAGVEWWFKFLEEPAPGPES